MSGLDIGGARECSVESPRYSRDGAAFCGSMLYIWSAGCEGGLCVREDMEWEGEARGWMTVGRKWFLANVIYRWGRGSLLRRGLSS